MVCINSTLSVLKLRVKDLNVKPPSAVKSNISLLQSCKFMQLSTGVIKRTE